MKGVFVSPIFSAVPKNRYSQVWIRCSAVGPTGKFVINIVRILIAKRDSSAVVGHNRSNQKALKQHRVLS